MPNLHLGRAYGVYVCMRACECVYASLSNTWNDEISSWQRMICTFQKYAVFLTVHVLRFFFFFFFFVAVKSRLNFVNLALGTGHVEGLGGGGGGGGGVVSVFLHLVVFLQHGPMLTHSVFFSSTTSMLSVRACVRACVRVRFLGGPSGIR